MTPITLATRLAELGKSAGAPWGKDQKEAAAGSMGCSLGPWQRRPR